MRYEDIRGAMVGLYCPDFMRGLNCVGRHFHFIKADGALGGHVLQVSVREAETDGFNMAVSLHEAFKGIELAKAMDETIRRVEKAASDKNVV